LLSLLEHHESKTVAVDLRACQVTFPDGLVHAFEIDEARRETLLQGLDPVTIAASHEEAIAAYQRKDLEARPWVWLRSR